MKDVEHVIINTMHYKYGYIIYIYTAMQDCSIMMTYDRIT